MIGESPSPDHTPPRPLRSSRTHLSDVALDALAHAPARAPALVRNPRSITESGERVQCCDGGNPVARCARKVLANAFISRGGRIWLAHRITCRHSFGTPVAVTLAPARAAACPPRPPPRRRRPCVLACAQVERASPGFDVAFPTSWTPPPLRRPACGGTAREEGRRLPRLSRSVPRPARYPCT